MKRSIQLLCVIFLLTLSPGLFADTGIESPNYGWLLVKTGFVLIGLCFTAYIGLKYLSKVSVGVQGPMKILGRLPIEGRRSVVVIDVAGKTLIVGNSEAGMHTLGELDSEQRAQFNETAQAKKSFKELLQRRANEHPIEQPIEEEA